MASYVQKLGGHTDVVTDVAFAPNKPYFLTGCQDGILRSFESA
jgi:WD40 repeat protein